MKSTLVRIIKEWTERLVITTNRLRLRLAERAGDTHFLERLAHGG